MSTLIDSFFLLLLLLEQSIENERIIPINSAALTVLTSFDLTSTTLAFQTFLQLLSICRKDQNKPEIKNPMTIDLKIQHIQVCHQIQLNEANNSVMKMLKVDKVLEQVAMAQAVVVLVCFFIFAKELLFYHYFVFRFAGSNQPVGGKHVQDPSQFSQEQLHPGMNPDATERGRQLGHQNAQGGQSVGTGGHGK